MHGWLPTKSTYNLIPLLLELPQNLGYQATRYTLRFDATFCEPDWGKTYFLPLF